MIIYIFGEDTYRSREYLREQVEKFKAARDPQGYNVVFLDGRKETLGKIVGELTAAPFLAEKRMVIIENVLESGDKELLGELIARVRERKIPENNVAVFWQGEARGKVKEVKELEELLKKEKFAKEFAPLSPDKLMAYANGEITRGGGKIGRGALQYLVANTGDDMWHLRTLIDQLLAYKHGEEIELADVQLFLEEKIDDNVFALTDAIVAGNHKTAFKLLDGQRKLGAEDPQIFGAILWQFRVLVSMRDLYERGDMKSEDMAKTLKLHPFVVRKNLAVVKKYTLSALKEIYARLLDIDVKTKTGFAEPALLMDLFVGRV